MEPPPVAEAVAEPLGARQPPNGAMLVSQRDFKSNCLRNVTALAVAVAPAYDLARSVRTAPPSVRSTMSTRTTSRNPKNAATSAWLMTTCHARSRSGTTAGSRLHGSGTLRAHDSRAVQISSEFSVLPALAE